MSENPSAQSGGFRDAGLFMLAWVLWFLLVAAFGVLLKDYIRGLTASYLVSGAMELLLLLPAAAYMQMRRIRLRGLFGRSRAAQVVSAAFMGALLVPVTLPVTVLWSLFVSLTGGNLDMAPVMPLPQNAVQCLVAFAVLGAVAPLAEEPVMRGLAMNGCGVLGGKRAVLLTGALFVLVHGRLAGLPAIFLAALLLGLLAWRSGSLWPSVAAHASFNAFSLLLSLLTYRMQKNAGLSGAFVSDVQLLLSACAWLLIALPCASALAAVLWAFLKYTPRAPRAKAAPRAAAFAAGWPWLLSALILLSWLAIDVLRIYGIIRVSVE